MLRLFSIILCGIITSCYFFPLILRSHLWFNTKTVMAAIGLLLLLYDLAKNKNSINLNFYIILFLYALIVSMVGYLSIFINNTPDTAYATYISSMAVWLCAAYVVVRFIKLTHKELTFELIANYIIGICVFQCIITLCIEYIPFVKNYIDRLFFMDQEFLKRVNRLYGLGSFLDTAGIRYSVALIFCAYLILKKSKADRASVILFYILSFFTISIIGNMVARTTSVGMIMGTLILITRNGFSFNSFNINTKRLTSLFMLTFILVIPFIIYFYHKDIGFREQIEFGFEGFFSMFENGQWEVGSNIQLKRMIVWPENLKTWIIGDGYFSNPYNINPYYTGEYIGGYYMGTDIGYLRFIFYFGILGLVAFSAFIIKSGELCMRTWPNNSKIFT